MLGMLFRLLDLIFVACLTYVCSLVYRQTDQIVFSKGWSMEYLIGLNSWKLIISDNLLMLQHQQRFNEADIQWGRMTQTPCSSTYACQCIVARRYQKFGFGDTDKSEWIIWYRIEIKKPLSHLTKRFYKISKH